MASLTITTSDGAESTHELAGGRTSVGRSDDNDITVDDSSLSSNHAEVVADGDGHKLVDLGSTNGTHLNGEKIDEAPLSDGDNLMFGSLVATYHSASPGDEGVMPAPEPTGSIAAEGPATTSLIPNSFSNASPFTKKVKQKDSTGQALLFIGGLGILACIAAVACSFMM